MPDESPRDRVPLQREVEPPRTAAGLWLPFMALASAAMLTIVSGIAVMTREPRGVVIMVEPASAPVAVPVVKSRRADRMEQAPRVMCRAPVHRGNVDGEPQPYDECIVPPGFDQVTHSRPSGVH